MDAYGFGYACGYWHVCRFKNIYDKMGNTICMFEYNSTICLAVEKYAFKH